jgi:molybdopterin synthase catalytic subunit
VSAVNREVAFRVAREALERVKHEVPIFKLERRDDGDYWVVGDGRRIPKEKKR